MTRRAPVPAVRRAALGLRRTLLLAGGLVAAAAGVSAAPGATPGPGPGGVGVGQPATGFPRGPARMGGAASEAVRRLGMAMQKRVSVDLKDAALDAALNSLSEAGGVPIRAEDGFRPDVRLTLRLDNVGLGFALDMIAKQAGATIRPDPAGTAVILSQRPPSMREGSAWAPEWFGPVPTPPPTRLSPQSVTALDATHFVVLSMNTSMGKPVQVGEGENAATVILPMAVLTLYRIESGKMVQESSTLHRIPEADIRKLMEGMQRTGWSGGWSGWPSWPHEGGRGN